VQLGAAAFGPYGWFIDELYYRACASRLAWGYVDHPPLSVAVLAVSRALFGDSLVVLRVWPALAVAGAALLSGKLAQRLGGGLFARSLAVVCVLSSPVVLVLGSFFSMNSFELLSWPACALVFVELLEAGGALWLAFGGLLGLAVLNKHTSATFGAALLLGSLFTPARAQLRTRWPWLGGLVAALVVLPNVLWQMSHDWPSLEFYERAQDLKNIHTPALQVLAGQVLVMGPAAVPIAILGVAALLRDRSRKGSLALGTGYLLLLAALILSHSSRSDRLVAYYPIVFAAGAAALERTTRARFRWVGPTALGLILLGALALAPVTVPVFSPPRVAAYAAAIGIVPQIEKNRQSALPQWFADRLNWPDFVADVARVYRALPVEEQAHARIFAPSYGEAGALERWGPALGLPPVLCNHNTYYLWSQSYLAASESQAPEQARQAVLISVGMPPDVLKRWFERVEVVATFRCEYCIDWRRERVIAVARAARGPLLQFWPELKHFE